MSRRPLGITFGAILFAVNAAAYSVFAALALFDRDMLRSVLSALSPSGMGPEAMHMAMGRLLPLYYIVFAGLTVVLALGFWKLWNWARLAVLALLGLSLLALTVQLRLLGSAPSRSAIALTVLRLGLIALVGWYLVRTPVRDAFRHCRTKLNAA